MSPFEPRTLVEEVFFAPVGSMIPAPDTRVIEREGWYQVMTPSSGSTIGNEVIVSRLGADAEAIVRATIREYADAGVPFKWCVGPPTEPADLGALLERYGFTSYPVRGMARATAIDSSRGGNREIEVIVVEPDAIGTIEEYFDAFERGWGPEFAVRDPVAWRDYHRRAMIAGGHRYFLARIAGVAVGTAGLALKPTSGYLIGGNVLAEYRNRGVYRALVDARLRLLGERGVGLATTQAREATSAPMLERMGFESVYRSHIYRLVDPADAVRRFGE